MNYRVQYTGAADPGFEHQAKVLLFVADDHLPSPAQTKALHEQLDAMAAWCREQFGDPFLGTGHFLLETMKWRRLGNTFLLRDEKTTRAFMERWTP